MQQIWSIRSRAHECAATGRPFEDGEVFHTAIHFDPKENGYVRRDISREAWKDEQAQRKPVAAWKTVYQKVLAEARPEIAPKESAMELLQRFIEDGDPMTENARYILALMLERKRQISQTAEKEIDGNKMLFYENKKTGQIFIVRDPELKLNEVAQIQEEVATILAFGGPAADAAKAVGVTLTPHGVVPAADAGSMPGQEASSDTTPAAEAENNIDTVTPNTVETEPAETEGTPESPDSEDSAAEDEPTTEDEPSAEDGSVAKAEPAAEDNPEHPHDGTHAA